MIAAGINSAARFSASSGVCLYLNVSIAPGAAGAAGFEGFAAAVGASFFTAGATLTGGFPAVELVSGVSEAGGAFF
jgi:hypothetical protein